MPACLFLKVTAILTDQLRRTAGRLIRSPWVWWAFVAVAVLFAVSVFGTLDRFLEWDEAVFYSQSGGYRGTHPPQLPLAASREGGPGLLILLALSPEEGWSGFGSHGCSWRWSWLLCRSRGLLVTSHRLFGIVSFAVFGFSWLSLAYMGALYGSLLNGLLLLLGAVLLVDLQSEERFSAHSVILGVLLGAVIGGAVWMRQVESAIAVLVLLIVTVAVDRARLWRRQGRALVVGMLAFAVTFAIPWTAWTVHEFGSIGARLDALRNQASGNAPLRISNGSSAFLDAASGTLRQYGMFARVPVWPRWIVMGSILLLAIGCLLMLADRRVPRNAKRTLLIVITPALGLSMFFAFVYSSVEVRERYLAGLVPFAAAAAGVVSLWAVGRMRPALQRGVRVGAVFLAITWIVAQFAIAGPFQHARSVDAFETLLTSDAIRVSLDESECFGLSRYGRAQIQVGTGCRVTSAISDDVALATAAEIEASRRDGFILWPHRLELGDAWLVIDRSSGAATAFLHIFRSTSEAKVSG